MPKLTVARQNGWPIMNPLGKKEAELLRANLTSGEQVLGQVIANFSQAVIATNHKVLVLKHGLMAGQTFGGKATSFDYRNIGAVEIRTGFSQGEPEIINPSMPSSQGNRNRDKVKSPKHQMVLSLRRQTPESFRSSRRKSENRSEKPTLPQRFNLLGSWRRSSLLYLEQIKQLGALHSSGVLTDEEFSTGRGRSPQLSSLTAALTATRSKEGELARTHLT